ncbi:MAG TPA: UDP-N-acetyl glucosamine 2-epimerase, partial [Thermoplasmata archaeon]|nr:UDP-N-acetyl glucosamine 2-epimerase [Thermoplasmata archaeon]
VGHVEAGLRSFNRRMPEELNRIVADHLSSLLFCPTQTSVENLEKEGIEKGVHLVGDVMYDVALASAQAARKRDIVKRLGLAPKGYVLATVHRPGNVDEREPLESVLKAFSECGETVVFPVHPRTRKKITEFGLEGSVKGNVRRIDPVDYLDFLALLIDAKKVATDSGGVQKEAYFFGIPCVTLRDETEWIETVEDGWNAVVGTETADVVDAIKKFNPRGTKSKSFGDGHAAEKIAALLESLP